jgi:hypothetical protein
MRKDRFNLKLRECARTLSPSPMEQLLVNKIYESFNDLLGINDCIQIGSYPRFTAITPIHDLDILYILGQWNENEHSPFAVLKNLFDHIDENYINPTKFQLRTSLQTHSVTIAYLDGEEEIFSVDIVPAYSLGRNEFDQDMYKVPEVIKENSHKKRNDFYLKIQSEHRDMSWINSDPRGYIKMATEVGKNTDFRKTVKIIKRWKDNLKNLDESLKLKSFHLEQVITKLFQQSSEMCVVDAIFKFFVDLPDIVNNPNQIKDRAKSDKFIDDYLKKFTSEQKERIKQARDYFLIKLENLDEKDDIDFLWSVNLHKRKSFAEEYLFDQKIPIFTDPQYSQFSISADITDKIGNVQRPLNNQGMIDSGRYLKFKRLHRIDGCMYKWKVKNDDSSDQPRGEITDGQTMNVPENTKYKGRHYAECYAIKDDVCVARAKQAVVLLQL